MKIFLPAYNSGKEEKIVIDDYDIWSLDYSLAKVVHPCLILLKEKSHGGPFVDFEDVPENLRPVGVHNPEELDDFFFDRWNWVLDQMIWSFGELAGEERWDKIGDAQYYDRIQNGLRLFAKYYMGLWD